MNTHVYLFFCVAILWGECSISATDHYSRYQKISWSLGNCHLEIMESCKKPYIRFFLHTKKDEKPTQIQLTDNLTLPDKFDLRAKTKVLIHGYAGLEFNETQLIKDAYLQHGSYNVLTVDWGSLVRLPCYLASVLNTRQAGKCTAAMIIQLAKQLMFRISKIHIIGFSLGAHVAAFASNHIKKRTKKKIGRITGLDPALPFFATRKNADKLDKSDATFVDIIHTNSGVLGKVEATGHADFYVNGGIMQLACRNAQRPHLCSHLIANIYYMESILSQNIEEDRFNSIKCDNFLEIIFGKCVPKENSYSTVSMGEPCTKRARGLYYVTTGAAPPFATTKEEATTKSNVKLEIEVIE